MKVSKVIEEEADHLGDMIEDLLDASRLQANSVSLKKTEVYLPELIAASEIGFRRRLRNIGLLTDFPPDFPVVNADEKRMEQVISNLMSNAIKYSPGGEIIIEGHVNNRNAIICVKDEGPGINPEDLPHIFDRFYRGPEQARKTKGAGLGLYLAKAIIEAHGGKIWVDSGSVRRCANLFFDSP